ncbi:sugar phosphate isomerase/epimerase family protein [Thalassobacillus pellis]|uniref:sugar phosphate isomerase/epimerase family protein n=1 Tax=Thalassobacillus pellis TaxID=748008 RepID=UPI00196209E0|nr:sugar phosphate isomerase/epimerase family protein [Thalassobacillus pellis]MBM7551585.1 hexulose-6-phosphate isomerase [Thalassobacillus pellis]
MNKGINAWCFPDGLHAEEIIKKAKASGFKGIEFNVEEKEDAILKLDSTEEEVMNIKETAGKYDIDIFSISTDMLWKYPLTSENKAVRQKGMQVVEKMIRIADQCEAKTVLVVPGIVTEEVSYDTAYERSLEAMRELSAFAEEKKIRIGIENVWNKFLLSPLEMARFIEEINSPYAGVYLDIGNVVYTGFPEQWIKILAEKIVAVHIKDFKTSVGNMDGFVPLLAGDIAWDKIAHALEAINYNGFVSPEIPPHPFHTDLQLTMTSCIMDHFFPFDWREN